MSDELCFVQFPHPGGEHKPDFSAGPVMGWKRGNEDHARKFMVSPGAWCDRPGDPIHEGEIFFWGEWEAASTFAPAPSQVSGGPSWLHRPFFEGEKDAPSDSIPQNTDPFVFGDRFLYTYCRQPGNRRLRELAPGSVILFGSRIGSRLQMRFVLDAVFVVGEFIDHTRGTYMKEAVSRTNSVFRATTLDPMYRQGDWSSRLYLGATIDGPVNGMFSFVPCLPAQKGRSFARPAIQLPDPLIRPGRAQEAGTTPVDDLEELRSLWERVVEQVIDQNQRCALGVRVELPGHRP